MINENKSLSVSVKCFSNICNGISSDEAEEKKKEMKLIFSEKHVIIKNIKEMLDKYNEVEFPSDYIESKVEYLIQEKLISKHT